MGFHARDAAWTRLYSAFGHADSVEVSWMVSADWCFSSAVVVLLRQCARCLALSLPAVLLPVDWGGLLPRLEACFESYQSFVLCVGLRGCFSGFALRLFSYVCSGSLEPIL